MKIFLKYWLFGKVCRSKKHKNRVKPRRWSLPEDDDDDDDTLIQEPQRQRDVYRAFFNIIV